MTRLVDALQALGITGEVSRASRWVTIQGERCPVHVIELPRGEGYYTWCDDPAARVVKHYRDPTAAIEAGLRRAARRVRKEGRGG